MMRLVFTYVFPVAMTLLAVCAAWFARKSWRDPDNWHIDPDSKRLAFHSWSELGLACVVCVMSAGMAVFGALP